MKQEKIYRGGVNMNLIGDPKTPTGYQIAAFVIIGVALGFVNLLGLLPAAGVVVFLACAIIVTLFRSIYRYLVLAGIVLLACVFMEPAPSDIILVAAIALGLVTDAFKPQAFGRASLAAGLMFIYFIVSLPGIAVSVDVASALRYYLITSYLFLLSLFICIYSTQDNITALLRAYVLAAFLSFIAGFAGQVGLFPDLLMADPYRVKGLFKDPNVYGPFFVPAIVLLLDDIKGKRILKTHAAFHSAGIILLSLGVVFSYSRAAWINLAAAGFVYILLNLHSVKLIHLKRITLAVVAVSAAAAFMFSMPVLRDNETVKFLKDRIKLQEYDEDRFSAQRGGLELMILNPLGIGPGQFESRIGAIIGQKISAHSLYIRTAAENGIAGFLFFFAAISCILILLWFIHCAFRKSRCTRPNTLYPTGSNQTDPMYPDFQNISISPAVLISIIIGILVNSLVVDTLHWRHFWFFIGIALYCLREAGKRAEKYE
jgi:O-antigen ligase